MLSNFKGSNPNAELLINSQELKEREEGELSPDDGDLPALSEKVSLFGALPFQSDGNSFGTSANECVRDADIGNLGSEFKQSTSDKLSKGSFQLQPHMGFDTKRVASKSGSLQHVLPSANDNLVIKFSDDSESESEDSKKPYDLKLNGINPGASRKPPVPVSKNHVKMDPTKVDTKMIPPNMPSVRPSFPSWTNKVRGMSSEHTRVLFATRGRGRRAGNTNLPRKSIESQEHRPMTSLNFNDSKLQDLRHQIAMKERRLRLKSTQNSSGIPPLDSNMLKSSADRRPKETSATEHTGINVPASKRLKVGESHNDQLGYDCSPEVPATNSVVNATEPVKEVDPLDSEKEICVDDMQPSTANLSKQDTDSILNMKEASCNMKDGAANCTDEDIISNVSGSLMQNQPTLLTNACPRITSGTRKDIESTVAECRQNHGSESDSQCLGVNLTGHGSLDFRSLVEMEERLDKELEEAQAQRHKCEIEERNALKAHRRAQSALLEANTRCSFLYHRRETCATHFHSMQMDNCDIFWSPGKQKCIDTRFFFPNNASGIDASHLPQLNILESGECADIAGGHKYYSEACSEPQGSTSAQFVEKGNLADNGITHSAYNDDAFYLEKICHAKCNSPLRETDGEMDINVEQECEEPASTANDSLHLEACLRSELFARLGDRVSSKNSNITDIVKATTQCEKNDNDIAGISNSSGKSLDISKALNNQDVGHRGEECPMSRAYHMEPSSFSGPIIRSAFQHFNDKSPNAVASHGKHMFKLDGDMTNMIRKIERVTRVIEISSYSCEILINLFWPLCMYELRGKCNSEECSWQHAKDYKCRNLKWAANLKDSIDGPLANHHGSILGNFSCQTFLAPPTYLVSFDILGPDVRAYNSSISHSIGPCRSSWFSASLATTRVPKNLALEHPLQGSGQRIEVLGSCRLPVIYSQKSDNLEACMMDDEHILETVFSALNKDSCGLSAIEKAAQVLARAIEANKKPALWIAYLHVLYKQNNLNFQDDPFFQAVNVIDGLYELWMLYINSRRHLNDRISAYDLAISALCRNSHASETVAIHNSACILDVFFQMLSFLCMSEKLEVDIETICGFPGTESGSIGRSYSFSLSELLSHLTVSDKCSFWVCCVYILIYRKFPVEIEESLDLPKVVSVLDWPASTSSMEKWVKVDELLNMAVSCIGNEDSKAVHTFAVNHARCIIATGNLDRGMELLEQYMQCYPSSLELVLTCARLRGFDGFESALRSWPGETPVIQCIWYHFVEFALQNCKSDAARQLINQWFNSSEGACISTSPNQGSVFELLNLGIFKLLQNDPVEAGLALDRAVKIAAPGDFILCAKEHAVFLRADGQQLHDEPSISELLKTLENYIGDPRSVIEVRLLSRRFIGDISSPRTRDLMINFLGRIPPGFTLINSILEAWFGPSLLPLYINDVKYIYEFVEAVVNAFPSNYQVVMSLCTWLNRVSGKVVIRAGVLFWAGSLLVNTISRAIPVAPERVWVEAAEVLGDSPDAGVISGTLHCRALSVYPFSVRLWRSYLGLSRTAGNRDDVVRGARARGIQLE